MSYLDEPVHVMPCEWHEEFDETDCLECAAVEEAWIDLQVDRAIEDRFDR
jgi:hypothetical protein